jgi:hypothetical protein
MPIEQAIFTSAVTRRGSGYHLASRSAGLIDADARELTAWGPSHDSLVRTDTAARSVNFFSLTRGAYCVSRTVCAGVEYSERGGWRVLTHCLVIESMDLARFANNPFAVVRAAIAAGELDVPEVMPQWMESLTLSGRARKVEHTLLYRVASRVAVEELVRLISAAFEHRQLLVSTNVDAELLIAGVVNTLPPDRRPEFSFSTGLRFSTQRPFRVTVVPASAEDEVRHATQARVPAFEVRDAVGAVGQCQFN